MTGFDNKTHISKDTENLITKQLRLNERLHPLIRNCCLTLDRRGAEYRARYTGYYKEQALTGEATDQKPLRAFLLAFQELGRQVDRLKIKNKVNESMASFNFA